jgi:hypothetical protein
MTSVTFCAKLRIMIGKITSVAVIGDRRLEIAWDDGHVAPSAREEA